MTDGFRSLLPASIAVRERRGALDADDAAWRTLPEPERAAASVIVARRRVEFATGRTLARVAMQDLGEAAVAVPRRADRAPTWPPALVGAITHCDGLVAVAVAHRVRWRAIGIDAEVADRVDAEIVEHISSAEERRVLEHGGDVSLGAVLFAAKECVQKAFGPQLGVILPFTAVEASDVSVGAVGSLGLTVRDRRLGEASGVERIDVRWRLDGPFVLAALALPAP